MMGFILVIHSLVCVLLLLTILMQSGRGGGLTEQFQCAESVFGAQTNVFMVRLSSVLASIFFVTCLALAFMSARQERSLVAERLPAKKAANMTIPLEPAKSAVDQAMTDAPAAANALVEEVMPAAEKAAADAAAAMPDVQPPVTANAQ